jgi:uncharacterized protein (DUF983 family)
MLHFVILQKNMNSLPAKSAEPNLPQKRPQLSRATMLGRALRLRCPLCGKSKMFRSLVIMHKECPHCHLTYSREPGYYLGSIYINYALTAVLMTAAYFYLFLNQILTGMTLVWTCFVFALVFPILFFPFSRAIWLALDLAWDPPTDQEQT